jgi:(E)-4-hydroxy-3-methylbut-2-enyl-diphosphate synthase
LLCLFFNNYSFFCIGTRFAVTLRGDESYEQLDVLKSAEDITMLLHNVPYGEEKTGRVQTARR